MRPSDNLRVERLLIIVERCERRLRELEGQRDACALELAANYSEQIQQAGRALSGIDQDLKADDAKPAAR